MRIELHKPLPIKNRICFPLMRDSSRSRPRRLMCIGDTCSVYETCLKNIVFETDELNKFYKNGIKDNDEYHG